MNKDNSKDMANAPLPYVSPLDTVTEPSKQEKVKMNKFLKTVEATFNRKE